MGSSTRASKRELLIAESARLFRRQGYGATAMSEIAEATKLNKGTLYYYYASKSDILFAIYTRALEELDARIALVDGDGPVDRVLVEHVRAILHTIRAIPDVIAVYFQEHPWLEHSLSKEQAAAVRQHEKEFSDHLIKLVRRGIKTRVFHPVDPELFVTQLLASTQSFHRWRLPPTKVNADKVAEATMNNLLDGIRRR